jgi:hypothetical protein
MLIDCRLAPHNNRRGLYNWYLGLVRAETIDRMKATKEGRREKGAREGGNMCHRIGKGTKSQRAEQGKSKVDAGHTHGP